MPPWPDRRSRPRSDGIVWRIDSLDERLALSADSSAAVSSAAMYADAAVDANAGVEFLSSATLQGSVLQGSVFVDSQRNMVHDAGEAGVAGVEVKLIDQLGNVVASQETGARGEFAFVNVDPGIYDLETAPINGYVDGGQRVGSSGGDALFDHAIRGIDLAAGETAEGYAFTVLSPEIKPDEPLPLPKPVLHAEEKADPPPPVAVVAVVLTTVPTTGSAVTSQVTTSSISIETATAVAAPVPTLVHAPIVAGSTLDIPVSGLDSVDTVDDVAIASVAEHGNMPALSIANGFAARGKQNSAVTLSGDFDGDGDEEAATFGRGKWWIDQDGDGRPSAGDSNLTLGSADGLPVVADLNGDGKDELVVVPQSMAKRWQRHVQPKRTASSQVHAFAGDWMGSGRESIGLSTAGQWWLDLNGNRKIDAGDRFGEGTIATNAPPAVADANQDGADELVWDAGQQGDAEISSRNADRAFESFYER